MHGLPDIEYNNHIKANTMAVARLATDKTDYYDKGLLVELATLMGDNIGELEDIFEDAMFVQPETGMQWKRIVDIVNTLSQRFVPTEQRR